MMVVGTRIGTEMVMVQFQAMSNSFMVVQQKKDNGRWRVRRVLSFKGQTAKASAMRVFNSAKARMNKYPHVPVYKG